MATQKGENGILYIYEQTAWKPVACLTSNSLSTTVGVLESQTKCFPGVIKKSPGIFSYSIDAEGEMIDTTTAGGDTAKQSHDALLLLQMAKTPVDWKIDVNVTDPTSSKYYGTAILTDLSADMGAGDEFSTFSVTLDGDGAITLTNTHPSV